MLRIELILVSDKWYFPHAHKKYCHPSLLPPFENTPTPLSKNTAPGQNKHKNGYIRGNLQIYHILSMSKKRGAGQQEKNLWGGGCGIFDHLIQKSDIFLLYLHVFFQNIFLHWWWWLKITPPLFFVQFGGKSAPPPPRPIFFKNLAPLPPLDILPKIGCFFYNLQWGF